ncbi:MAG TPA: hypothetical protein VFB04_04315 [Terriglobales bacterium]|nr:hypothetical protein [Terriglobales bacterium]
MNPETAAKVKRFAIWTLIFVAGVAVGLFFSPTISFKFQWLR